MHGLIPNFGVPEPQIHYHAGQNNLNNTTYEPTFSSSLWNFAFGFQQPSKRLPTVLVIKDRHGQDDYAAIKRVANCQLGMHTVCVARNKALNG